MDNDRLYIRVSASAPKWFTKPCICLEELYPDWDLITGYKNGFINEEEYEERYGRQLSELSPDEIRDKLKRLCEENGRTKAVLLCWCSGFCHRHILNKWLGGFGELY